VAKAVLEVQVNDLFVIFMQEYIIGLLLGFIFGFVFCVVVTKDFIPQQNIAPKIALYLSKTDKTSITPQEVEELFKKKD
jgi:Mg/Co/Ni transporter MgtE